MIQCKAQQSPSQIDKQQGEEEPRKAMTNHIKNIRTELGSRRHPTGNNYG